MNILKTLSCTESPWIEPKRVIYENDAGDILKWDYVERTNARTSVLIMARFKESGDLLFIRQYRVIFDNYVIAFPAGVLDDDTVEACALRELREETGYTGKVVHISPGLPLNSALVREIGYCVVVELEEDASPQPQELEPSEKIEVHRVRKDKLAAFFEQASSRGDLIAAGLWYILMATQYL
ncbi:MAG: NUDIX hydrolase [Thermodesulfobacteriota bacterium]|nr:NUDIX hydrolase [Thermodesulfobacteriota bacterium]